MPKDQKDDKLEDNYGAVFGLPSESFANSNMDQVFSDHLPMGGEFRPTPESKSVKFMTANIMGGGTTAYDIKGEGDFIREEEKSEKRKNRFERIAAKIKSWIESKESKESKADFIALQEVSKDAKRLLLEGFGFQTDEKNTITINEPEESKNGAGKTISFGISKSSGLGYLDLGSTEMILFNSNELKCSTIEKLNELKEMHADKEHNPKKYQDNNLEAKRKSLVEAKQTIEMYKAKINNLNQAELTVEMKNNKKKEFQNEIDDKLKEINVVSLKVLKSNLSTLEENKSTNIDNFMTADQKKLSNLEQEITDSFDLGLAAEFIPNVDGGKPFKVKAFYIGHKNYPDEMSRFTNLVADKDETPVIALGDSNHRHMNTNGFSTATSKVFRSNGKQGGDSPDMAFTKSASGQGISTIPLTPYLWETGQKRKASDQLAHSKISDNVAESKRFYAVILGDNNEAKHIYAVQNLVNNEISTDTLSVYMASNSINEERFAFKFKDPLVYNIYKSMVNSESTDVCYDSPPGTSNNKFNTPDHLPCVYVEPAKLDNFMKKIVAAKINKNILTEINNINNIKNSKVELEVVTGNQDENKNFLKVTITIPRRGDLFLFKKSNKTIAIDIPFDKNFVNNINKIKNVKKIKDLHDLQLEFQPSDKLEENKKTPSP
ncbi:hypothetical protein N9L02_00650 [Gammaproteobacteria bacterium]|nr:hypothetical protein [Gammaproteobacteria bacterium]